MKRVPPEDSRGSSRNRSAGEGKPWWRWWEKTLKAEVSRSDGSDEIGSASAAEELMRQILESAGDGIFGIDREGRAIFVNDRVLELLGGTREQALGRKVVQLVTRGRHTPKKGSFIFQTMEDGAVRRGHLEPITGLHGRTLFVDITVAPLWRGGTITGAVVTFRDVTDRLELEEDLQALLEHSEDFIYFKNRAHQYTAMSRKLLLLNGLKSFDEVAGKDEFALFPVAVAKRMRADEVRLMESGGEESLPECRWLNPSGKEVWTRVVRKVIKNPSGEVTGLFAVGHDITRMKRASDQIRRSEELLRAVLNHIEAALVVKDVEGRYLIVNQHFEDHFGLSREQIIGRRARDLFPAATASAIESHDRIALAEGRPVIFDVTIHHADGTPHAYAATVAPLSGPQGKREGLVTIAHDVTERDELERQLLRARDAAAAASTAKSEFLANMSHEIRTPLNAIIGFSELLEEEVKSVRSDRYLRAVRTSADALLSLINDVLDLAKVEAGKMVLQPVPTPLGEAVRETCSILETKARERGVDLVVEVGREFPEWLLIDETRFRQVVLNLVGNAVKFTHSGGVLVELRAFPLAGGSWEVLLRVVDTGIGIPPEAVERIFGVFEQQSGPVQASYGGTGLGLAITRRLVDLMDGEISVESVVGEGSVFSVKWRCVSAVEQAAVAPTEAGGEGVERPVGRWHFAPARVLVVDDIAFNREVVVGHLSAVGLEISEAAGGAEALAAMRASPPAVVVLDLRMPEVDGLEVARAMLADPALAPIAIVGFTASTSPDEELAFRDYCRAFLRKPVRREQLLKVLADILPGQAARELGTKGRLPLERPGAGTTAAPELTVKSFEAGQALLEWFAAREETLADLGATLAVGRLAEFAREACAAAERAGSEVLAQWARDLEGQAELFELDGVIRLLDELSTHLTALDECSTAEAPPDPSLPAP